MTGYFIYHSDVNFHIGLPPSEEHTVSRLTVPSTRFLMREILYDPRVLILLAIVHLQSSESIAKRIVKNPSWVRMNKVTLMPPASFSQIKQAWHFKTAL